MSTPDTAGPSTTAGFDDVMRANAAFAAGFHDADLPGHAAKNLAILTCIDSRIDPLAVVGMRPGDAFILRNAGAHATDDALRALVLATCLMSVTRILVMPHTGCAVAERLDSDLHARIAARHGLDAGSMAFGAVEDQVEALGADIARIRSHPFVPDEVDVGGALYDVRTGRLERIAT